jgi:hypothetical protein
MKPPMERVADHFLDSFGKLFNQVRANPPPEWDADEGSAVMMGVVQAMVEMALPHRTPEHQALAKQAADYVKQAVTVTNQAPPRGPAS